MLNKEFIPELFLMEDFVQSLHAELFLDFKCTTLDVGKDLDIYSISFPCMVFRCQGIVLTCITI